MQRCSGRGVLIFCAALSVTAAWGQITDVGGLGDATRLEINMGGLDFSYYDDAHVPNTEWQSLWRQCGVGKMVRDCFREILSKYVDQGITGVRFQVSIADAMLPTKDGNDHWTGDPDYTWLGKLEDFYRDIYCGGKTDAEGCPAGNNPAYAAIPNVTMTLDWGGGYGGDKRAYYAPGTVTDLTAGAVTYWMVFSPTAPYGGSCDLYPTNCNDTDPFDRIQGYQKSPRNPEFIGWPKVYTLIREIVHRASLKGLKVEELDAQNEIVLHELQVRGRLMVDNTVTPYEDVLGEQTLVNGQWVWFKESLRKIMFDNGFDPYRVIYSVQGTEAKVAGGECASWYGDSARIDQLSMTIAAMGGGQFGNLHLNEGQAVAQGLPCTSGVNQDDRATQLALSHSSRPSIIDVHRMPCVALGDGCDDAQLDKVPDEARRDFAATKAFVDSYGVGGWRCPTFDTNNPNCSDVLFRALVLVGDVHGHTVDGCNMPRGPGYATNTVAGFRSSVLVGRRLPDGNAGVVFRPWEELLDSLNAWQCNPVTVNPPYSPSDPATPPKIPDDGFWPSGATSASQWFTFKWKDVNGWANLAQMHALFNTTGCYIRTDGNSVWLGNVVERVLIVKRDPHEGRHCDLAGWKSAGN